MENRTDKTVPHIAPVIIDSFTEAEFNSTKKKGIKEKRQDSR